MKITREDADKLFLAMTYALAPTWTDEEMEEKLNQIDVLPNGNVNTAHELRTLYSKCMRSVTRSTPIVLADVTEQDVPRLGYVENGYTREIERERVQKIYNERRALEEGKPLKTMSKKSRGYYTGWLLGAISDGLTSRPNWPNKEELPKLVQRIDESYQVNGGPSNYKQTRWYFFLAKSIIEGYFDALDSRELRRKKNENKSK
jgi:hypothetical protein